MPEPGRILLIEDNEDDELLTLRAFKKSNLNNVIDVLRDGEEAIKYFSKEGKFSNVKGSDLSLILLDLNLPKVHGLEVLKFLKSKEEFKKTPVVILTTSTENKDLKKAYELGVNSYVQKPVVITEFIEAMIKLEIYWCLLNKRAGGVQ